VILGWLVRLVLVVGEGAGSLLEQSESRVRPPLRVLCELDLRLFTR